MEELKKELEVLGANVKEAAEAAKEVKALNEKYGKYEQTVKEINDAVAKQGGTVEDIRNEVLALKERQGSLIQVVKDNETTSQLIKQAIRENYGDIAKVTKGRSVSFDMKAVGNMTSNANAGDTSVETYLPGSAWARGRRMKHVRDLVPVYQSATGTAVFWRQNTPAGEGAFASQSPGVAKAQLDYDVTKVTETAMYLAGYARVAKEMLQDLPFMESYIPNELVEDYMRTESNYFGSELAVAATGSTTTSSSATVEKIIDYVATLYAADYNPNAIVVAPAGWAAILKTLPTNGSYSVPGGITITPNGDVAIVGIPVHSANWTGTSGKVLVGDFSKAGIIQADGLKTEFFEQDQDNVIKNLITIRTEARVALAVFRPDAFVWAAV